jgi:hypothetical protein
MGEIKQLNQAIQAVQSDISKHRESLEDCLRFKVCWFAGLMMMVLFGLVELRFVGIVFKAC